MSQIFFICCYSWILSRFCILIKIFFKKCSATKYLAVKPINITPMSGSHLSISKINQVYLLRLVLWQIRQKQNGSNTRSENFKILKETIKSISQGVERCNEVKLIRGSTKSIVNSSPTVNDSSFSLKIHVKVGSSEKSSNSKIWAPEYPIFDPSSKNPMIASSLVNSLLYRWDVTTIVHSASRSRLVDDIDGDHPKKLSTK